MAKWSSDELPIPRFIEFGETESGFFAVSERIHGDSLDKLDSQRVKTVFPSLFRVMDTIRDIDISDLRAMAIGGQMGVVRKLPGKKHYFRSSKEISQTRGTVDGERTGEFA